MRQDSPIRAPRGAPASLFAAILLLAGLGAAILAGCGEEKVAGEGPILIGHYASLTGSEATFGKSTDEGIQLAVKERNAAGGVRGRQIKLITYDNQGKNSEVTSAVTRLITRDKVVAVLGEVASGRSLPGAEVCQRYGVPMITPSSTKPSVTEVGDMIFRVCFIDPFQGGVCAKFAKERGWTKAATLYDRTAPYSTGLNENFKAAFTALGGTIVTEQAYSGGDSDYGAQLTAIRGAKPDVIFVPGYYTDVGNIALQVRNLGLGMPLLGGDGWDSSQLAVAAGSAIEGCFYSNHYSHEEARPAVQTFVQNYRAEFDGRTPDGLAALGYDAAMILFHAMEKAPSLQGKDLAAALASVKEFAAVTGTITIDGNRNAQKSAVILEMRQGQWRYVATIEATP